MRFERVLPAAAESVAVVRHGVRDLAHRAHATPDALEGVLLAVSEAATNVVMHAYVESPAPGPLRVDARADDHMLEVAVEDDGRGVKPRTDSPGLGIGMTLMAQLSESMEISHNPRGGTRVVMRFSLDAAAPVG